MGDEITFAQPWSLRIKCRAEDYTFTLAIAFVNIDFGQCQSSRHVCLFEFDRESNKVSRVSIDASKRHQCCRGSGSF